MRRPVLALLLAATAATAPALPATAGTTDNTRQTATELQLHTGDVTAPGGSEALSVSLAQLGGVWHVSVRSSHAQRDVLTGAYRDVTTSTRGLVPVPEGAVTVSDNGHVVALHSAPVDVQTRRYEWGTGAAADVTTAGTTTVSGTWRLAGGDVEKGRQLGSFTLTPFLDCASADHYEDRVRVAEASVTALDRTVHVKQGSSTRGGGTAVVGTYLLRGTESC